MMSALSRTAAGLRRTLALGLLAASAFAISGIAAAPAAAADASTQDGSAVYIGPRQGYAGTGIFPVYTQTPADPGAPGEPDLWAYCIEHGVSAKTGLSGVVGGAGDYLGSNFYADPAVQAKVAWVLAHSYPALSLADFGASVGAPGIARNDAVEAAQYAIWRYTELTFDAPWAFETADSATAYWALLAGANADTGATAADTASVSIAAPSAAAVAGTLAGPFVVSTNRATAVVAATPTVGLTDAAGAPIDPTAVVDGQAVYLDLRGATAAGATTLTATVAGSTVDGRIVSVPTVAGGTPTPADHAQSIILVAAQTATTTVRVGVSWAAATAVQGGTTGGAATQVAATSGTAGTTQLAATGYADTAWLVALSAAAVATGAALLALRRRARA